MIVTNTACLEVRKLTIDDGHDIYEMLQELPADDNGFINSVQGKTFDEYKEWLKKSAKNAEQVGVSEDGKVGTTIFWLFENGKPVGIAKVRHSLTDALLEQGGNVGYAIRPTARDRGLGTRFLSLLIVECKKLGIEKILLTIQNHNKKSISMGLANGGKIEKITEDRHYIWLET